MSSEPTPVSRELQLLEQVHMALGSAHKLDDFYAIVAGLLVSPEMFGFSRAFILRYDETKNEYQGRMALGARSAAEHQRFRKELKREQAALRNQIDEVERETSEPAAVQQLYDLRFHSLWVQLLQGRGEGTALNGSFINFRASAEKLPPDHLCNVVSKSAPAALYHPGDVDLRGLGEMLSLPVVAARIKTRRGLHGIVIADRQFEDQPLDERAIVQFQTFINHASVTVENVELVEELTLTAQRTRELDRLKTNFLSIVSHELRTPLTSIIGFVHLLHQGKAGEMSEQQKDLLARVANHSGHLQNMVNDILEIAEVESGGIVSVVPQPVDPIAVLWRVIPKMESRKSSRKVSVEPLIEGPVPEVRTDPTALERIYYHLIDNAIKFIPQQGSVTISFRQTGNRLEITISDTGIGMTPENLKKVFDHFYQVDYRLERAYGGMGIGLTVVKLLLDATGGTLNVESTPGEGSRFTISFPVV